MPRATQRPTRRASSNAAATARPWVKPQAGTVKSRRANRDGTVTVFRVDTDRHGVVRRSSTTIVPN